MSILLLRAELTYNSPFSLAPVLALAGMRSQFGY
jgi:hypothetical protein